MGTTRPIALTMLRHDCTHTHTQEARSTALAAYEEARRLWEEDGAGVRARASGRLKEYGCVFLSFFRLSGKYECWGRVFFLCDLIVGYVFV